MKIKKYTVPLVMEFKGLAVVNARDEDEAENIASTSITGVLSQVSGGNSGKITHYIFESHSYADRNPDKPIEESPLSITPTINAGGVEFENESKMLEFVEEKLYWLKTHNKNYNKDQHFTIEMIFDIINDYNRKEK